MSKNKLTIYDLPPDIIEEFIKNPIFFSRIVFDNYLWSKQREICYALIKYKRVVVYSATGTGKSFLLSNLVHWFLQTRVNSVIPIIGANYRQVLRSVWRLAISQYSKARIKLMGEPTSTKFQVNAGQWYAEVLSARKIEALQGIHAPYTLFLLDESSGIEEMVFDAVDGNLTGGDETMVLMVGNPLRPEGRFYRTMFDPKYYKVRISIFDTPLLSGEIDKIPEKYARIFRKVLPTPEWVEEMELKYGKDSPFYKAKILGLFPEESEMGMFNLGDIEYAMSDNVKPKDTDDVYITVDPARYGEDYSVIYVWKGYCVIESLEYKSIDTTALVGIVSKIIKKYNPEYVIIDETGVGGGMVDFLINDGYDNIVPINFSQNAVDSERYANLPTEMMFLLKEAMKNKIVKLPKSDLLKQELLAFEYTFDSKGRFKLIDSKTLKKKKLKRSPDHAYACGLRFAPVVNVIGLDVI